MSRNPVLLYYLMTSLNTVLAVFWFITTQFGTGYAQSITIQQCLLSAVGGNPALVAFPDELLYQEADVKPYNLDIPVTPAAVTFPESAEQVAAVVECAAHGGYKVQARSGGHSFGNYGM
jgi:FAD binding domain